MKRWQPPVSVRAALGVSAMVAVLLCCQMAGLAGYALIFPQAGRPIPWLAHLTVSFFGFAAFIGLAALGSFWLRHSDFWKKQNSARWGLLEETLEALSQIARGNFTVRVSARENEPFAELAASVNKMA
ncbi:MAG: hypothetical protein LBL37_08020, partial [Gracilibacteraceae bacterium]|nr:hypothetical protein [Gracilibacteraceae bacterium]